MVNWRIATFARVRPFLGSKHADDTPRYSCIGPSGEGSKLTKIQFDPPEEASDPKSKLSGRAIDFSFDQVFEGGTQDEVYSTVTAPIVAGALEGFNGTLFAYGQTGSGKTYSMTGGESYADRGMVPRALQQVYAHADAHPEEELKIFVSYMEIYNETCYDLLDTSHNGRTIEQWNTIKLQHNSKGSLEMRGLQVFEVPSEQDALNLLFLGNMHRMTAETLMNRHPETTTLRSSKLHLVDLAGSERVYKSDAIAVGGSASGAASVAGDDASSVGGNSRAGSRSRAASGVDLSSGASVGSRGGRSAISVDRRSAVTAGSRRAFAPGAADGPTSALTRREGRFINLSLHYLEKVIIALQDRQTHDSRDGGGSAAGGATSARSGSRGRGGNSGHVPYRNSTLTAILKDSLGGNCRTAFLATLNPEPEFTDECISTCRFAQRCGMVTTRVQANATTDLAAVVASLRSENDRLNARVAQLGQIIVSLGVPLLPVPDEASGSAHAGGGTTPSRGAAAQHSGFGASSIPLRVQQITADDISRAQHGVAEFLKVGLQSGTADRGVTPHDSMQAPAWYWIPGLNLPQMHIAAHLLRRAVVHASRAASAARQGAAGGGSTGPSSTPTPPTLPPPPSLEQVSPAPAAPAAQAVSGIPGGLPSSAPPRTSAEGGGSGVEASSAMSTPQRRAGVDDTDAAGAALRASAQSDRAVKRRLAAGRSVSAEEILPGSPSHSVQPVDNAAGTIVARSPLPIAQLSQQQSLGMQSARQLVRPKHPTLGDGSVAEAPFSSPGAASPDRLAHTEADTDPSQAFRRLLVKGAVFQKSSKKGLRRRFVHVSPDLRILFWRPVQSSKIQGACDVRAVLGVVKGAATVSAGFTDGGLGMEAVSVTADDTAVSLVTRDGKVITLFVELPAGSTHFDDLDAAMQSAVRQARNVWADAFTSITTAENTTIPSNESVHEVRSFTTADAAVGLRDENSSQLSPSQTASERSWV